MHMNIKPGEIFTQYFTVTEDQTAKKLGSGNLEVFATPAMIACMENTAMKMIMGTLPQGMDSVGTEINVKHLKASAVGEIIKFEAKIITVEDKKVQFEISASNQIEIIIGTANHTRYIIDVEKFMGKLGNKK
jgi:fluoroacetyl-CoA thioesterase